jgi:raffinose/stachyose/melibiose transport system substrate-binding protein
MNKALLYGSTLFSAFLLSLGVVSADVTLTLLTDNSPDTVAEMEAITAAYTAKNPDVTFEIELRPGGGEGDNIVKSRLATGEMTDVFFYNSGSLFQALRPQRNLLDVTELPAQSRILQSFKPTVTAPNGRIYGVPFGSAMGGGIFYNRAIYKDLGLSIPKSWDEFMANNAKIKSAGKVAVAGTFKDTWTSQLFVLADFYNVQAAVPSFAADYTANKAKYASIPAAMRGFKYLQEVYEAGFMNEDFGAATFIDGMRMVSTGEAAHYPMLTFGVGLVAQSFPDSLNNLGFFAQPGPSASSNGLTVWMPGGMYIAATTEHPEEAKDFLNFVASKEGCDILSNTNGAQGPYLIKGCSLPSDVPPAVADLMPYFENDGTTAPALEFVSPIKGPALEQITVEVGSGIRSAADGAALYDIDVEKQARQLGLAGW